MIQIDGRLMALAQCGTEMVVPPVAGIFLDQWLGTTPWFIIIMTILGFAGGLTHMILLSNQIQKDEDAKKKT